jgi:hypothetical protein
MTRKPPKKKAQRDDPGVAEVRRWRAKMLKENGGTLRGLSAALRERQDALEAQGKIVVRRRPEPRLAKSKKRRAA